MDGSLHQLLPMYERARAEQDPLVLATVIATRGSTYRKAGAQMLIGPGGRYEGILSGGCLEGDLAAHAASVLHTGRTASGMNRPGYDAHHSSTCQSL